MMSENPVDWNLVVHQTPDSLRHTVQYFKSLSPDLFSLST